MGAPKQNKGMETTPQQKKTRLYPCNLLFSSFQTTHNNMSKATSHPLRFLLFLSLATERRIFHSFWHCL